MYNYDIHFEGSIIPWVLHGIRFVEASAESHRCFSRQPGPGSYEGRYDGGLVGKLREGACNECRCSAYHTKNLLLFKLNSCFFRKDFRLFFSFKYQSFFETSENLSHFYKFILSVLRRLAMISTFRIHPLWENSDTYLLTIGCMLGGTPGFAESSRRGGGIGEICETLSMESESLLEDQRRIMRLIYCSYIHRHWCVFWRFFSRKAAHSVKLGANLKWPTASCRRSDGMAFGRYRCC